MKRILLLAFIALASCLHAEDGYDLWLRYPAVKNVELRQSYLAATKQITLLSPDQDYTPTLLAARQELTHALQRLLGVEVSIKRSAIASKNPALGEEGYALRSGPEGTTIEANTDIGVLYGSFAFLRLLQTEQPVDSLAVVSVPKIQRRLLNHWDNLNRTVERGYAGFSIWEWFALPDYCTPRYRDYARACASIGINGAVLNNVNSDVRILTPFYLEKVAAIANELRPYGLRVYLCPRFSSPIELGKLKTADPLDPEVAAWWKAKIDEIYSYIPDFGGFLVKANSEGQPGPQDYHRNHADGANMLADALAPHGGIVMWRAFVYKAEVTEDRAKQAYSEFKPLDGKFRPNVVVQIKNGPVDFMPREPFSPLFGAMPDTNLALELQITQEYLGGAMQMAYLGTLWEEALDSDTYAKGPGSTVAKVIEGKFHKDQLSVIAGVSNIGTDRNWTGHPMAQANWYAFGRLAWDPESSAASIAEEWTRMTFGNNINLVSTVDSLLLQSREAVVDYSMPLGLHHLMAEGHHYGPGPWFDKAPRADWTSTYYHKADALGLGFDRTSKGSGALDIYNPEVVKAWGNPDTCPEEFLLWFHHVPWAHKMKSGHTLWDELCLRYQRGVNQVRCFEQDWDTIANLVDRDRHAHVSALLRRQEKDAIIWRDACLLYFQQFSKRPFPPRVEKPAHALDWYMTRDIRPAPGHN